VAIRKDDAAPPGLKIILLWDADKALQFIAVLANIARSIM
jgi:hypothetical protein